MQDGRASLPFFVRWWIVIFYPPSVIREVDEAGWWHDLSLWMRPSAWRVHNAIMVQRLEECGVPRAVYMVIECGLWIYWNSPAWLRRIMWRMVPRP